MRSARSPSSLPSSAFARADAPLMRPSQRTTLTGTRSPETGKLSTALVVSPPHSCSVVSAAIVLRLQIRFLAQTVPAGRASRAPLCPALLGPGELVPRRLAVPGRAALRGSRARGDHGAGRAGARRADGAVHLPHA